MRAALNVVKEHFGGKVITGAEIGVWRSENAEDILSNIDSLFLILVDSYIASDGDENKEFAQKRLSEFKNKQFIFKDSVEASKDFDDNHFDFIYIDAGHDRESVMNDLVHWYPKVKDGGIVCGHDYGNMTVPDLGVNVSVDAFFKKLGKEVHTAEIDWWVFK